MAEKIIKLSERCQYFSIKVPSSSAFKETVLAGGFLLDRFMAAYVLASGDSVLFIDSGWDEDLADYMLSCALKILAEANIAPQRYFLLNTHRDWDHAWANRAFKKILGEKLHIGASLETFLSMRQDKQCKEVERRREGADGTYFASAFIELPDLLWADKEMLHLGSLEAVFIKVSAHSEGQLAVWLPQLKILLAADSCEGPLPFPKNDFCLAEQLANFRRLLSLCPAQVWPSHHLSWSNSSAICPWSSGEPELLQANNNYYKQIKENCCRYAPISFKRECGSWLRQHRASLSALLNNEDDWSKSENKEQSLLAQLQVWEKYCHIDIEQLAEQTGQDCSNWSYQRAHHLAALMYLEQCCQMI